MKITDENQPDENRRQLLALAAAMVTVAAGKPDEALAQDATKMQPNSYRVAFENDKVRVLDFDSRPGFGVCGIGVHSHPAHLTVLLSAAKVRVKVDGKTILAENKLGDVFWDEAVTHEVENVSGANVRSLIIELKNTAKT